MGRTPNTLGKRRLAPVSLAIADARVVATNLGEDFHSSPVLRAIGSGMALTKNGDLTPKNVTAGSSRGDLVAMLKRHDPRMEGRGERTGPRQRLSCLCGLPFALDDFHSESLSARSRKGVAPKEKNGVLKPSDVTPGSGRFAWWCCSFRPTPRMERRRYLTAHAVKGVGVQCVRE